MSITVKALTLTLMLFLQLFWGSLPPRKRTPNLAIKQASLRTDLHFAALKFAGGIARSPDPGDNMNK